MKVELGKTLALYPMPVAVIGSKDKVGPTWTLVAHMGILGHDHILVSLATPHYINSCIKESGYLSINLVNEALLAKADYAGSVSAHKESKDALFDYEEGRVSPIIKDSPLVMECRVEDIYITPGFENFICVIERTVVDDLYLKEGKIDFEKIGPILFDMPNYEYLGTGKRIGKCLSFKSKE